MSLILEIPGNVHDLRNPGKTAAGTGFLTCKNTIVGDAKKRLKYQEEMWRGGYRGQIRSGVRSVKIQGTVWFVKAREGEACHEKPYRVPASVPWCQYHHQCKTEAWINDQSYFLTLFLCFCLLVAFPSTPLSYFFTDLLHITHAICNNGVTKHDFYTT